MSQDITNRAGTVLQTVTIAALLWVGSTLLDIRERLPVLEYRLTVIETQVVNKKP